MAITRTKHTNTDVRYDYAIDGIPFFSAASSDIPYQRDTADWLRDSLDVTAARGEQSLSGWWYRSQSSFHLGAGLTYFDPMTTDDIEVGYRFADSMGVDIWTPGKVTLLRDTSSVLTIDSGDDNPCLAMYEIGGPGSPLETYESGVLASSGGTLYKVKADGTHVTVDYGADTESDDTPDIFSLVVSGPKYYVASNAGIFSGSLYEWINDSTPGTAYYEFDVSDEQYSKRMAWIKDRFIASVRNRVYELTIDDDTDPETLPDPLFEHPLKGFQWSGFASGPDCIYMSGYRGHQSTIYATTLETTEAGATPTLSVPYVVVDMPQDEMVLSMVSYMGTYLVLGTTLGVRVCIIGSDGQVTLGPLSIESDNHVNALTASGKYIYAGGSYKDSKTGLYRLDLSNPVDAQRLLFPWARDIAYSDSDEIESVAEIGATGRMAFATAAGDVVFGSASTLVTSGYLTTGKIRFNTWEKKVPQYLKVATGKASGGTIQPAWVDEADTAHNLTSISASTTVFDTDMDAADGEAHQWWSYKFTLSKSGSNSPVLCGYQVKANPNAVKPRSIRVALMCSLTENPPYGRKVTRSTWDRITDIESRERSGELVWFQDFGTGEERLVVVDRVQFIQSYIPEQPAERADPSGVLVVTLRTVT